jgi:serpin B
MPGPSLRAFALIAAVVTLAVAPGCGNGASTGLDLAASEASRRPASAASIEPIGAATNAFAGDLYRVLSRADGNLVFSPYSAAVALSMARAGAVGATADEMDAVLRAALAKDLHAGFNAFEQALASRAGERERGDGSTATIELETANQLWGQRGLEFHDPFLDTLAANYGAGMRLVDYVEDAEGARVAINDWVAERTRDRIDELIGPGVLDAMTRLVLTNAIYLKAPWEHPFDESGTQNEPFRLLDGSVVDAPLMRLSQWLPFQAGEGYSAVELPYAGGELSMVVIVPDTGQFEAVQARLDGGFLGAVTSDLQPAQVRLRMPKFTFRTQASLSTALAELGMPTAFTDAADFSGMTDEEQLLISDVLHEAFIAVDEEGTEAAAATAVIMAATSAPVDIVDLTIDRPFLFLIQDTETGAILFLGRVLDPTA